jgi:hypothetical protein
MSREEVELRFGPKMGNGNQLDEAWIYGVSDCCKKTSESDVEADGKEKADRIQEL